MSIAPNFSIVTLGVRDLAKSIAFYRALGWEKRGDEANGICWFKTSGTWIGLFGYGELAQDAALPAPEKLPEFRGLSLALNMNSVADVNAAFDVASLAGAKIVKAPHETPWGGYSGYFADPDGHLWEIAHAPMFPVDKSGRIEIR